MKAKSLLFSLSTIACAALFVVSASAVVPPERPPATKPYQYPWSEASAGMRVRLVPQKKRFKVGEKVVLRLEIQNVSGRDITFEEPQLFPVVADPDDNPLGDHVKFPWKVTAEPLERKAQVVQRKWDILQRLSSVCKLGHGQTYVILITGHTEAFVQKVVQERRPGEPQKESVEFAYGNVSGRYRLQAEYRPEHGDARIAGWRGRGIKTPPIEIVVKDKK